MSFSARRFVVKAIPHRLFPLSVLALLCAAPAVAEDSQNLEHIEVRHHQSYRGQVPVEKLPQAVSVLGQDDFADWSMSRFQDVLDLSSTS